MEFLNEDLTTWNFDKEVEYNNNQIRQREKYRFFQFAFDYLKANQISGDYYEFGCHRARTFRMSLFEARKKNLTDMHFYAFDSFEGLPEAGKLDTFSGWHKGALSTSEDEFLSLVNSVGFFTNRIDIIKGFYNDSLTADLQKDLMGKGSKIALAYIDSDFYTSAIKVLEFIEPLLQEGSLICFDDWFMYRGNPKKGEQRAFAEFCGKTELNFVEHLNIGWFGKSFIVVKN